MTTLVTKPRSNGLAFLTRGEIEHDEARTASGSTSEKGLEGWGKEQTIALPCKDLGCDKVLERREEEVAAAVAIWEGGGFEG